ncbi:DUF1294 domain-containing protein [Bacillus andreraoultii]|uniref:DUF1294 domain-containing protein n=1 Tax=Bacillus andreraoultii TaxID=1499685 RepID=UPI000AD11C19|nr:DUF1294 domain-containing protein [Bacillus andreraoultii]
MKLLFLFLVIINVIGFLIMGIDKRRAQLHQWRIPENTLWLIAFIGGSLGTTLGMYIFKHKTKHFLFRIGFPLLFFLQTCLFLYFRFYH